MEISCITGNCAPLEQAFTEAIDQALAIEAQNVIVLVPSQTTLQVELKLLSGKEGSFRLQVLSPARLYTRIFAEVGSPQGVRIDTQGRVMLLRSIIQKRKNDLIWYKGACDSGGFAEKTVSQIEIFKQAGITPEILSYKMQNARSETLRNKLHDIFVLYQEYEARIQGKFLDGEDEAQNANARMAQSEFVQSSAVYVYGFDTVSPALQNTILALAQSARSVCVFLMADADLAAPDGYIYNPVLESMRRLFKAAAQNKIPAQQTVLPNDTPQTELRFLQKAIYGYPCASWDAVPRHVQAVALKNAQQEAEFAAGLVKHLVIQKNWRYKDILIACKNLDNEYADALKRAFALYDVPIFLTTSRSADRHPFARYFLALLRMSAVAINSDDMLIALRSGYLPLEGDARDVFINYVLSHRLYPKDWLQPFRYGKEAEELEPYRKQLTEPILALATALRENESTTQRLTLLFTYLEENGITTRFTQIQDADIAQNRRERAAESAQVFNRVIAAIDQLHELLSEDILPLAMLPELFEQSLATQEIKQLPQSPDAVNVGDLGHMKGENVKALFLLGLSDAQYTQLGALLDEAETQEFSGITDAWLGLTAKDTSMLRLLSFKGLLNLPQEYLYVSYPMSGANGSALREGSFLLHLKNVFPKLVVRDSVSMSDSMRRLRLNSEKAALTRMPSLLREEAQEETTCAPQIHQSARSALKALSQKDALLPLQNAAKYTLPTEMRLPPKLVRKVYGDLTRISVTRLESYAACPYRHFVEKGLRPVPFRPFDLQRDEQGTQLHNALEQFVEQNSARLSEMPSEEASQVMLAIAQSIVDTQRDLGKLQGTAGKLVENEIKRKLFRAAGTIAKHLHGSQFTPLSVEKEILPGQLMLDHESSVIGYIDRIDYYNGPKGNYVRVIDYKSGVTECTLSDIYNGQRMQLTVYLRSAAIVQKANPAGAFYFGIKDPIVQVQSKDTAEIEAERDKQLHLSGFMVADTDVLHAMSDRSESVLSMSLLKDGSFSARSLALPDTAMQNLLQHVLRLAQQYLAAIKTGDISVRPAQNDKLLLCSVCPAKTPCPFDATLPEAQQLIRILPKLTKGEVIDALSAENSMD